MSTLICCWYCRCRDIYLSEIATKCMLVCYSSLRQYRKHWRTACVAPSANSKNSINQNALVRRHLSEVTLIVCKKANTLVIYCTHSFHGQKSFLLCAQEYSHRKHWLSIFFCHFFFMQFLLNDRNMIYYPFNSSAHTLIWSKLISINKFINCYCQMSYLTNEPFHDGPPV